MTQKDLCLLWEARGCKFRRENHHLPEKNTRISPHQVLIQTTEEKTISLRKEQYPPEAKTHNTRLFLFSTWNLRLRHLKIGLNSMYIYKQEIRLVVRAHIALNYIMLSMTGNCWYVYDFKEGTETERFSECCLLSTSIHMIYKQHGFHDYM